MKRPTRAPKGFFTRVGPYVIAIAITRAEFEDDNGKPAWALADWDAKTIQIRDELPRHDRLKKLMHESSHLHEWCFGAPADTDEARAQRLEAVFEQVMLDVKEQGGEGVLMALEPNALGEP